ncbi:MAG TPA: hypothetical protein VND93_22950, partial [Myxococcales bacterium]|nr:hypothetical protein [Myxococcales bacterium]
SRAEEVGSAGSKLASGSEEYNALRASVEAKEELARRLRDSVPGGRNEIPPGARGHAMSGATGGASQEQIAGQAAKLEKEAAAGRKALEEADSAAEAVKAATPRNVWIENPKDFPHKINGSKPSRAMMNDNGTVRYQWLDEQKRVVQESAVLKDGRVTWGQAESGLIDVPAGARPGHTPNPITGAPAGNEIRGHFTPYEMTADVSNSGANMGKQSVIMNGTNPYRGLEEAAVEFGKDNPGKGAKYLVISKADQAGVETARRQVLWMRPPEGGRVIKEFDRTTQAINDASHPLQRALETSRQPKVKAPAAAPVAPPAAAPAGPAALPAPPVRAALPAPPARAALPAPH